MINLDHPNRVIISDDDIILQANGGTTAAPKGVILQGDYLKIPAVVTPAANFVGGLILNSSIKKLQYNNGSAWLTVPTKEEIVDPLNLQISNLYAELGTKVDAVTYQTSNVPTAAISGTTLNIVFPTNIGNDATGMSGLFTSAPTGSIMAYSLVSGQNYASIRAQLGNQTGRDGSASSPYVTATGWTIADGKYWSWSTGSGTKTVKTPNMNQNGYLRGTPDGGVTKTDAIIPFTGGSTNGFVLGTNHIPEHYHLAPGMRGVNGDNAGQYLAGSGSSSRSATNLELVNGVASAMTTKTGGNEAHAHGLPNIEPSHYNVVWLYNIAEPELAMSQATADSLYVKLHGDTMAGVLKSIDANPVSPLEFTNKRFVESLVDTKLNLTGGTVTGTVRHQVEPGSVNDDYALVNKKFVINAVNTLDGKVNKSGDTITGSIIHQVEPASVTNDYALVNKKFVMAAVSGIDNTGFVPFSGGTMTGELRSNTTGAPASDSGFISKKYFADTIADKLSKANGGTIAGLVYVPTPVNPAADSTQVVNVKYVKDQFASLNMDGKHLTTLNVDHLLVSSMTATITSTTSLIYDRGLVMSWANKEVYGSMNLYNIAVANGVSAVYVAEKNLEQDSTYTKVGPARAGNTVTFDLFTPSIYSFNHPVKTVYHRYAAKYISPTITYSWINNYNQTSIIDSDSVLKFELFTTSDNVVLFSYTTPRHSQHGDNGEVRPGDGITWTTPDGYTIVCSYNGGTYDGYIHTNEYYKYVINTNSKIAYSGSHSNIGLRVTFVAAHSGHISGNYDHVMSCSTGLVNTRTPLSAYY